MPEDYHVIKLDPYGDPSNDSVSQPNPTQQRTLDWWDNIRKGKYKGKGIPTLYLQGGVGCGKTRAVLAPVLEALMTVPGIRIAWGRKDYSDLRLSAMETFLDALPPELIQDKDAQEHRYVIKQAEGPGGQIFFKGLKDMSGLGSQEFGVIVVSEAYEITEAALRTLRQRCRQKCGPGVIFLEGNPPNEGHWLSEMTTKGSELYSESIEKWAISTYENWDNLPEAYREELEDMPEAWKRKYLYGKDGFIPDGKPVYPMYRENLHHFYAEYMPSKPIYTGWDFGFHRPAVVFTQIDSRDRWVILQELLGHDILIDHFAEEALDHMARWFPKGKFEHFGDPSGNQKSDKDDQTSIEILRDKGIRVKSKASRIRHGTEIVGRKMTRLIGGMPSLIVSTDCPIINEGFLGGHYYATQKENRGELEPHAADGYYEHLCDAVRYVGVNIFQLRQPVDPKKRKRQRQASESRYKAMANQGYGQNEKNLQNTTFCT